MGLTEKIAKKYLIPYKRSGSLCLFSTLDVQAFLTACGVEGVRVLGIEGFRVQNGNLVPDMEVIADFSELNSARTSIEESMRFVKKIFEPELLFDLAIEPGGD